MMRLYWPRLSLQSFWTLWEIGIRCALVPTVQDPSLCKLLLWVWRTGRLVTAVTARYLNTVDFGIWWPLPASSACCMLLLLLA